MKSKTESGAMRGGIAVGAHVLRFDYSKPPEPCPFCSGEAEWSGEEGGAACCFCGGKFVSMLFLSREQTPFDVLKQPKTRGKMQHEQRY